MTEDASTPTVPVPSSIRVDLQLIASLIKPGSRVLDVGCGDGSLLRYLADRRDVDCRGLEISRGGVQSCLRQGLSVVQGDAEADLGNYPSGAFDYVVLSETIQATHNPLVVLRELVRIGHYALVSFPNFGHWRCRLQLLFKGRMPVTGSLPLPWHATPNIHFSTITDFVSTCNAEEISVVRRYSLNERGQPFRFWGGQPFDNLLGAQGLFMLSASAERVGELIDPR
ncbi:MAG: methionine biosynthesis protein MetW [Rhodospirillaceae bacterium]|nr:methionine biosynthesis protein MetW [Rhodospirillaceae bacterium]